jgi:ubiquitin-like 1-activating enzyme E1 B
VFKVGNAVVLCVGAGGICCELLNTLVASGIMRIEVVSHNLAMNKTSIGTFRCPQTAQVDPDTVEASSIGWQSVFRARHVGRSKAEVAAEALRSLRPLVDIKAYHMDIRDPSFGVDFFRRFNLVVSTVENVEDKPHVNRLCLAANVPLISAGASEFTGQVNSYLLADTLRAIHLHPKD